MSSRLIRLRDVPQYLGMDKNRFNAEVRPFLIDIPIGKQGIAFDKFALDAWVDQIYTTQWSPRCQFKKETLIARQKIPGLKKIGDIWHIDKRVDGRRICESTGPSSFKEAEKYLIKRLEDIRQATIYGVRPKRSFRVAALKFVQENQHKRSILSDVQTLKALDPYIGELALKSVHIGALQRYIETRKKDGVRMRTINFGLQIVRRILNLAASEWMDEYGLT